jgi:hypothetical protein
VNRKNLIYNHYFMLFFKHRAISISALITALVILVSCGTEEEAPPEIDFGADYTVIVSDEFPSLSGDELSVELFYTGCEPGHEFDLNSLQTAETEHEVWLTKITPNDECNTEHQEVRVFTLPEPLLTGRLIFTAPNAQIVLRDG